MPALTPEQEALRQDALTLKRLFPAYRPEHTVADGFLALLARLEESEADYGQAVDSVAQLQDEVFALQAQLEAAQAAPDVLFDGMAVYEEFKRVANGHLRTSPENVSDVLDAAVRLIRAAPGEPQ